MFSEKNNEFVTKVYHRITNKILNKYLIGM